ncbi:hypothetical protein ABT186_44105 [Streptomyces sp. NPDC001634]|uniref:hypothetical protein n=1 Tax=Streptomyces sp. NPDC001634 TaxID=3154390 RepID=UPI0033268338
MAHQTPAPLRTLRTLLRALGGLILLTALLAGTPYVLLLVGTQPTELSGGIDVLVRPDDGTLFFTVLTCIGWAAWAAFTWTVILEIIAVVRGRSAPRLRGLGGMQSLAAFLVGGIVLLAPTAASATSSPAAATTASQTASNSTPRARPTAPAMADTTSGPTHTVASPVELPWDLAEKYLGNGQRWHDIAALNPDIPGLASGDQYLPKGAVIKLPDDAHRPARQGPTPTSPQRAKDTSLQKATSETDPETSREEGIRTPLSNRPAAAAGEREHVVTVHPGDYLSKIAQEELGDGNQWPTLFKASQGKPQPHGLPKITNPDVIYAGQQVTVPGAMSGQHERPTDDSQAGGSGSRPHTPPATEDPHQGRDAGNAPAASPSASATPAPKSSAPSAPASHPSYASSPDQQPTQGPQHGAPPAASGPSASAPASPAPSATRGSSRTAVASQAPASSPTSSPLNLRIVLGAGALLAAAITGALALRRTLQRRRRKPGETIAIAPQTSPAESKLAAASEPAAASRLDVALRTLAHQAGQDGHQDVPPLRAARIGARSLEVLPEDLSQKPRTPFTAGQAGWWLLPADAELLDEAAALDVPAPYPGLVTVGSTESGDLVLANLAQLTAVLLDGNPVHITEVCTSLAIELGMSPWSGDIEVVTIGFGEDLPQLLPTARIAHMRQAAHALRDLTERLLEAHQMPDTAHQPYLVLCAATLDPDTAWQFADAIDKAGRVPVTLIAPASSAAAHFPQAEILNASVSTPQQFDYLGTEITVQRLEHAAYQQITTALKVSGQPSHPADGPWQDVPDELDIQAPPEPDLTEEPTAAEAVEGSDMPAPVPAGAGAGEGEVFPALLAASADPSALRPLPGTPSPRQTSGDGAEEQKPVTAELPKDDPVEAEPGEAPRSPAHEPEYATTGSKEAGAHDLNAPEIRVLGPVEVDRVGTTGHGPRIAQLAALMFFRPGRTADVLCADMDPLNPWSPATLNARLQGLRRALGNDAAGNAYVPRRRAGDDPYLLAPAVRCDWTRFLQLAERALPQAAAGLPDLEKALSLVRGRPFGTRPLPWAEPHQQEMITRIIDVAHTVAVYRTPAGPHHDLHAARQAIATGLDVDPTAELLYRDWMKIERAASNRQGLHTAITRIQQTNRTLDCDLELETEQLINDLLNDTGSALRKAL